MLNAILRGKTNGLFRDLSAHEDFPGYEDSLTSTIVERIIYLPTLIIEALLKIPGPLGDLIDYAFWPTWQLNNRNVIPDCLLDFQSARVIIESKRWDDSGQQKITQWEDQIQACPKNGKSLYLLAIGGQGSAISEDKKDDIQTRLNFNFKLIELPWRKLGENAWNALKTLHPSPPECRILRDILAGLELHGIDCREKKWIFDFSQEAQRDGLLPINLSALASLCNSATLSHGVPPLDCSESMPDYDIDIVAIKHLLPM